MTGIAGRQPNMVPTLSARATCSRMRSPPKRWKYSARRASVSSDTALATRRPRGFRAAQTASKLNPELRRDYQRLKFRRGSGVAKVAMARKLAVRLYWKLREAAQPSTAARMQGSPVNPVVDESLSPK